jgi:hypothetical protein
LVQSRVEALPIFAHEYDFSCQKCHSIIPRLTPFGQAFLENGYHLPMLSKRRVRSTPVPLSTPERKALEAFVQSPLPSAATLSPTQAYLQPGAAFPLAVKANLLFADAPEPGYPRGILDEFELLAAGIIGPRLSYFGEQYVIDGGANGLLREAWLRAQIAPPESRIPFAVTAGQFTLPLPIDVESFRESAAHYAVWDQTVGENPFTFFDPKLGLMATVGSRIHGTSASVALVKGHDRQSGIATVGLDDMLTLQHAAGPLTLSAYRYEGRRPGDDHFQRTGYGAVYARGRWESDTVLQTGWDSGALGGGGGIASSGSFTQLRYAFGERIFGLFRLDGTNDTSGGFARSSTSLVGFRPAPNSRITLENTLSHSPETHNDFVLQYTVAY